MTKFIFVTGGVLSSLGKGISSAVIGTILKGYGYKVRIRKMDGYLNVDPGTMSPHVHGEVYVTDDGAETDLDLGHYERFVGNPTKSSDSVSAGQIYYNIIKKERRGDYLGSNIQVIPHVTDEIKDFILNDTQQEDFIIVEIGGTVGDIEQLPFVEAVRELALEIGRENSMFIHLTLVPYLGITGELKTKPTQASVRELLRIGIQPDMILCRCDRYLTEDLKRKIAMFCNVSPQRVKTAVNVDSIYKIPIEYNEQTIGTQILKYFNLYEEGKNPDLTAWEKIIEKIANLKGEVNIAVVGKYQLEDAYISLKEALTHAGITNGVKVNILWIDSEKLENEEDLIETFKNTHGILVPGGFGKRGTEGKIMAAKYARENNIPYFGICLGMQLAVIEAARNVLGIENAGSSEFDKDAEPVIGLMTEWEKNGVEEIRSEDDDLGGTMRLGEYPTVLGKNTKIYEIYRTENIKERHRHRYEMNINYEGDFLDHGFIISGKSPDGKLPEVIENIDHSWFIGVQFHPELKSKPFDPHPLFISFIKAAIQNKR